VQLDEHTDVILAREPIVGGLREHRGEQQLGVVVYLVSDADAREQAHRLDVIAVLQQVGADQRLGRLQITVREQPGRGNDVARQLAQCRHVTARHGGVLRLPDHAVQPLEHRPAARERMVDVDRKQECFDGARCIAQLDEAAPTLFMEPAEARVVKRELGERPLRLGDAMQVPLRDGEAQHGIAVGGYLGSQ